LSLEREPQITAVEEQIIHVDEDTRTLRWLPLTTWGGRRARRAPGATAGSPHRRYDRHLSRTRRWRPHGVSGSPKRRAGPAYARLRPDKSARARSGSVRVAELGSPPLLSQDGERLGAETAWLRTASSAHNCLQATPSHARRSSCASVNERLLCTPDGGCPRASRSASAERENAIRSAADGSSTSMTALDGTSSTLRYLRSGISRPPSRSAP
jgi:hypothetical protein